MLRLALNKLVSENSVAEEAMLRVRVGPSFDQISKKLGSAKTTILTK